MDAHFRRQLQVGLRSTATRRKSLRGQPRNRQEIDHGFGAVRRRLDAVRDDLDPSAIADPIERQQQREQVRASSGVADVNAIVLCRFDPFDRLRCGSGVMNDAGDGGLVQRLANRKPIHVVIVDHQNPRRQRLRAAVAIVLVIHGPSEPRGDEPGSASRPCKKPSRRSSSMALSLVHEYQQPCTRRDIN